MSSPLKRATTGWDFEDGVWVHRISASDLPVPGDSPRREGYSGPHLELTQTLLAQAQEIAARRPIDDVCAPIWTSRACLPLHEGTFRLADASKTTLELTRIRTDKAQHLEL